MTEAEWKERAAKRFIEKTGMSKAEANMHANACFDAEADASDTPFNPSADYNPEDCVDEEMSYWD